MAAMPRFAANLSMLFTEAPFLERFARARASGFDAVEFLFPYDHPATEVAAALGEAGLTQALFNFPPGDWAAGERGLAALPGRREAFERSIETALSYAEALNCKTLHLMSGLVPEGEERQKYFDCYVENLAKAAAAAAPLGITLVVEPLNSRDVPGYLIPTTGEALKAMEAAGAENLGLQFDFYHVQIMEGDLIRRFEALADRVAHVQIAGVPERHEPDEGEVAYRAVFEALDRAGFGGWVGCEYRPRAGTEAGLVWRETLT